MTFVKIRVPNKGFKLYFPLGEKDCNGCLSRVRPRMILAWYWSSVMECSFNQNLLSLCLSLPHSLSQSFTFLHVVSNHLAPRLPVVILDVISHPEYQSISLPNIFHLSFYPLSNIKARSWRTTLFLEKLSKKAIQPRFFPLSGLHSDPLPPHMHCGLCGPIYDSEINIFSTTYTWEL